MSEDLDLLQGSWVVTTLEVEGQKMPAAMLANAGIVIKGSRFTSMGMGVVYEGTLKLDLSASPRQLDKEQRIRLSPGLSVHGYSLELEVRSGRRGRAAGGRSSVQRQVGSSGRSGRAQPTQRFVPDG